MYSEKCSFIYSLVLWYHCVAVFVVLRCSRIYLILHFFNCKHRQQATSAVDIVIYSFQIRQDENIKYSSPDLLAQLASTQERVEMVLEKRKMIEDDIAHRGTILRSLEERRKMLKARLPVHTLSFGEPKPSCPCLHLLYFHCFTSPFISFAALIVASRLHGFSRSVKDVVKVVRLSHSTILQRLVDFGKTASSKLTVDEFNKIDLEEEADPPSFTRARQRAKNAQMFDENIKYSSPDLLAQLASTQERVEMVLEKRKMIEDDIAHRETILPSLEERRKMLKARLPVHTLNFGEPKPSCSQGCSKDEPDQSAGFLGDSKKNTRGDEDEECSLEKSSTLTKQEAREKELINTITLFNKAQKEAEDAEGSDVEAEAVQKKEGKSPFL